MGLKNLETQLIIRPPGVGLELHSLVVHYEHQSFDNYIWATLAF